jgi:putative tryptophan/tyrosine transport system substrate-binding protein
MQIPEAVRRVVTGIGLLALVAAILLFADRHQRKSTAVVATPGADRIYKIGIAYFAPEEGADLCIRGLLDGLADQGYVEGRNLLVRKAHAQAEISNIPAILQNFDAQDLDLIVPLTTPCLAAACTVVKKKPVVFTYVYDPMAAGAGKSWMEHLPNITGVASFPSLDETFAVIRRLVPGVHTVGTLYNSSEANSRKVVAVGRETCGRMGLKLEEVAVTGTSEVFQAAQALAMRDIQALWVCGDNTALQAFSAIAKVAADRRLPLITNDPEFVPKGALAAIGIGWYRSGYEAGKVASRVLRGESPAVIPMSNIAERKIVLNDEVALKLGISFPLDLRRSASQ